MSTEEFDKLFDDWFAECDPTVYQHSPEALKLLLRRDCEIWYLWGQSDELKRRIALYREGRKI